MTTKTKAKEEYTMATRPTAAARDAGLWLLALTSLIDGSVTSAAATATGKLNLKPHLVYILTDNLGWGGVGYHRPNNSEVQTPVLDELVRSGVELDRLCT